MVYDPRSGPASSRLRSYAALAYSIGVSAETIAVSWRGLSGGASEAMRSIRCSRDSVAWLESMFMETPCADPLGRQIEAAPVAANTWPRPRQVGQWSVRGYSGADASVWCPRNDPVADDAEFDAVSFA